MFEASQDLQTQAVIDIILFYFFVSIYKVFDRRDQISFPGFM